MVSIYSFGRVIVLLNCISILYPKYFVLGKKEPYNRRSSNLNGTFSVIISVLPVL